MNARYLSLMLLMGCTASAPQIDDGFTGTAVFGNADEAMLTTAVMAALSEGETAGVRTAKGASKDYDIDGCPAMDDWAMPVFIWSATPSCEASSTQNVWSGQVTVSNPPFLSSFYPSPNLPFELDFDGWTLETGTDEPAVWAFDGSVVREASDGLQTRILELETRMEGAQTHTFYNSGTVDCTSHDGTTLECAWREGAQGRIGEQTFGITGNWSRTDGLDRVAYTGVIQLIGQDRITLTFDGECVVVSGAAEDTICLWPKG